MVVFIDESGTNKQTDHSIFALAYIEVQDYQLLEQRIREIEKDLGIEYFHWSNTIWSVKQRFMDAVFKLDFHAKIAVVKNPANPSEELEKAFRHLIVEPNVLAVFIDGKKPRWYERKMKSVLKQKGISVKKLKTVDDRQYAGIRLADMIAGLARSYFDQKNIELVQPYYRKLEKKLIIVLSSKHERNEHE